MGKKSKNKAELTSSCPNNDEPAQQETTKLKKDKNKIVNKCESEVNERCYVNEYVKESNPIQQPDSEVKPNKKKNKNKIVNKLEPEVNEQFYTNVKESNPIQQPDSEVKSNKKMNKNKIVNNLEPDVNEQSYTNVKKSKPIQQPESQVEQLKKMNTKKNGASPEDEPIDESELDAFCDGLDEEANSMFTNWINLLEAKLSEGNGSQNTSKKKRKKKDTDSKDAISETREQHIDGVQKKIKKI